MIDSKPLAKMLCTILSDARIGQECRLEDQDATRPTGEYTTVGLPSLSSHGRDARKYRNQPSEDGTDLIESVVGMRMLRFSINFYRGDSATRAEMARMSFKATWAMEKWASVGMGFMRTTEVRNLSEMEDAGREKRHQFDVFFNTSQSIENVIYAINSIQVIGHYEGQFQEHTQIIDVENTQ